MPLQDAGLFLQAVIKNRGQEFTLLLAASGSHVYGGPYPSRSDRSNLLSNASKYTASGGKIELSETLKGTQVVFAAKTMAKVSSMRI
jgi:hypothetical protein